MKAAALVVAVAVAIGAAVILGAVLPTMRNAKAEGIAIGEEAGKVMWRVGAFYAANGRFPSSVGELRLPGAAVREYRLYDSEERRQVELAYSVAGREVTIRHASGKATFAAMLEQGRVARWELTESTYSASARAPVEFGAMSALRCLGDAAVQPLPDCARFMPAREAFAFFIGADPRDADTIRQGFARRFPPDTELKAVADTASRLLPGTQCASGNTVEYVCHYSFEHDAERRALYSVLFQLNADGTRVKDIAVSKGM